MTFLPFSVSSAAVGSSARMTVSLLATTGYHATAATPVNSSKVTAMLQYSCLFDYSVSLRRNLSRRKIATIGTIQPNTPPTPLHPNILGRMIDLLFICYSASLHILLISQTNAMGTTTPNTPTTLFIPQILKLMISLLSIRFLTSALSARTFQQPTLRWEEECLILLPLP